MDAQAWDQRYSSQELVWGAPPCAALVDIATALPRGRALDLACGQGRNALWLATRGWQVTGADYSQVALDKAAQIAAKSPSNIRSRLRWEVSDIVTADYHNDYGGPFDLIVMAFVQLPAKERQLVIQKSCAALSAKGSFFINAHQQRPHTQGPVVFSVTEVAHELPDAFAVISHTLIDQDTDHSREHPLSLDFAAVIQRKI
ncbi:MAG: class I SAM-dependent methyltransferase [Mycobacteriaceae bacterium]